MRPWWSTPSTEYAPCTEISPVFPDASEEGASLHSTKQKGRFGLNIKARHWKERLFAIPGLSAGQELKKLYREAVRIAWPAALEGMLVSVISAVDMMMVGAIGPAAIAAVGLTAQPRMILLILVQALNIGTTALIARRRGAGNLKGVSACLDQAMYLSAFTGFVMTLAGLTLAEPLMRFAGANEETLGLSVGYFRIVSLGFIPVSLHLCVCAAFRGLGRTRVTMYTHLLANLVNVAFNYLLIGGRLGFPRLGVNGAAIATVTGSAAGSVLAIFFAANRERGFGYRLRRPAFDRDTLSSLAKVGVSTAMESGFLRIGFLLTNKIIASLGTLALAAYHIVSQVSALSFTLGDGISSAGVAMVGMSLGADDPVRARRSVYVARRLSVWLSLALMLVIFALRRGLAGMFTQDDAVIAAASAGFLVALTAIMPQNGRVVYAGCLRGAGDVQYVAVTSLIGVSILRPLLTWLFCFPLSEVFPGLQLSATGPWFAFLLDALLRNDLLARRVRGDAWTRVKLK